MGIYNGLLSWQPVYAPAAYRPQAGTRFALPFGGTGPETSFAPNGSSGPTYATHVGPSWRAPVDMIVTAVRIEVVTALASNSCRLGLTEMGSNDQPTTLVADFGTVDCSSTGLKDVTGFQARVYAGRWYASLLTRFGGGGSIVIRAWPVPYGHFGQDATIINRALLTRSNTTAQTTSTSGYPHRPLPWDTVASGNNNVAGPLDWLLIRSEAVSR